MLLAAVIGFLFGYVGSVPVAGPIAVLVLARGLSGQFRSGLFISIGAAVAEGIYAFLAFWGFGVLLTEYPWIELLSRGAGAVILLTLGVIFLRPAKARADEVPKRAAGRTSLLLGFTITAMNPTLIATWTAAVTALFGTGWVEFSPASALVFGAGTILGIAGWFTTMLGLIYRLKNRFRPQLLEGVRRAMGVLLVGLGLWFAGHFVAYFI